MASPGVLTPLRTCCGCPVASSPGDPSADRGAGHLTGASVYTAVGYPSPVDFALAPEDEKFRDELRAWLDEHLPPFLEKETLGDGAQLPARRANNVGRTGSAN